MNATRTLIKRAERMMGTETEVYVAASAERDSSIHHTIDACMEWLHEVDHKLTRFDLASEICQVNAAAGHWHAVSRLTFDAIEEAVTAARMTNGLFDPTLLPILEDLGYDRNFAEIAHRETEPTRSSRRIADQPVRPRGAWNEIDFDSRGLRVRLPPDARLDLGGIAKGWAADVALERFFTEIEDVIISVGGDTRVRGGPDEAAGCWPLGIEDPRATSDEEPDPTLGVLTLGRGGMAVSGAKVRWWTRRGQRVHHLIDPRTGFPIKLWIDARDDEGSDPVPAVATASALAPTAAHAEVAAKVALVRGYPDALRAVEAAWPGSADGVPKYGDAGVALLLTRGTGEVECSSNLNDYLMTVGGGGQVWLD